jgi:hypothetical protein
MMLLSTQGTNVAQIARVAFTYARPQDRELPLSTCSLSKLAGFLVAGLPAPFS